ncbi:MAG: hypothetical protein KGO03_13480 [Gemmatimonadota bacterium]|nr:hypothetical protein [Gemmatimonadota bacterium]
MPRITALTLRPRRAARTLAAALVVTAGTTACHAAAPALAGAGPGGRARVDQAFTALYDRYGNIHHGPRYAYSNDKLTRSALVPSRVFDDSAAWTSFPDSDTRVLELAESVNAHGVTEQEAADSAPFPTVLGEARHRIVLHKLGDHDYSWDTHAEIAMGTIRAADVANGIRTLLTSADGRSIDAIRADFGAASPRTAAVAAQLFSLDSLTSVPRPDGSATVRLHFTLHPQGLAAKYPAFARYMQKYVDATDYALDVADRSGAVYFHAEAHRGPVEVVARVRGRDFLPLAQGDRPLPDSLTFSGWFTTKVSFFTVGVKQFTSDLVFGQTDHARSVTLHFHDEPRWDLPFAAAHFLHGPLKRPFEGRGMSYRVAIRDTAGAQTILTRSSHVEVHEGGVIRFIGGLISRVLLEQKGEIQDEEFRYYGAAFLAMRDDLGALLH